MKGYGAGVNRGAITFTTTGYRTTVAVGYTKIVSMAETLFGVFLTALFVFILARKVIQ